MNGTTFASPSATIIAPVLPPQTLSPTAPTTIPLPFHVCENDETPTGEYGEDFQFFLRTDFLSGMNSIIPHTRIHDYYGSGRPP